MCGEDPATGRNGASANMETTVMNLPKLEARLGKVGSALLTLGLAINLGSLPLYAWNNRGHMMVAAVAYQKLTPQAKDRVDALLLLNPDRDNWFELIPEGTSVARTKMLIFMIAATWAARIKDDPGYP